MRTLLKRVIVEAKKPKSEYSDIDLAELSKMGGDPNRSDEERGAINAHILSRIKPLSDDEIAELTKKYKTTDSINKWLSANDRKGNERVHGFLIGHRNQMLAKQEAAKKELDDAARSRSGNGSGNDSGEDIRAAVRGGDPSLIAASVAALSKANGGKRSKPKAAKPKEKVDGGQEESGVRDVIRTISDKDKDKSHEFGFRASGEPVGVTIRRHVIDLGNIAKSREDIENGSLNFDLDRNEKEYLDKIKGGLPSKADFLKDPKTSALDLEDIARESDSNDSDDHMAIIAHPNVNSGALGWIASKSVDPKVHEALVAHHKTGDGALGWVAKYSSDKKLLKDISKHGNYGDVAKNMLLKKKIIKVEVPPEINNTKSTNTGNAMARKKNTPKSDQQSDMFKEPAAEISVEEPTAQNPKRGRDRPKNKPESVEEPVKNAATEEPKVNKPKSLPKVGSIRKLVNGEFKFTDAHKTIIDNMDMDAVQKHLDKAGKFKYVGDIVNALNARKQALSPEPAAKREGPIDMDRVKNILGSKSATKRYGSKVLGLPKRMGSEIEDYSDDEISGQKPAYRDTIVGSGTTFKPSTLKYRQGPAVSLDTLKNTLGSSEIKYDPNLKYRQGPAVSLDTAKKLKYREGPSVSLDTAKGAYADEDRRSRLNHEDHRVRAAAVSHFSSDRHDLDRAIMDDHPLVRAAAAGHSKASFDLIHQGLRDPHVMVRMAATGNPKATDRMLRSRLYDEHEGVRELAKKRLGITTPVPMGGGYSSGGEKEVETARGPSSTAAAHNFGALLGKALTSLGGVGSSAYGKAKGMMKKVPKQPRQKIEPTIDKDISDIAREPRTDYLFKRK